MCTIVIDNYVCDRNAVKLKAWHMEAAESMGSL